MKYVNEMDVMRYFASRKRDIDDTTVQDLVNLANWFAEGAVTTLSNHLYDELHKGDEPRSLRYQMAQGCRCGSCHEWAIVGDDTGDVSSSVETLGDWVKEHDDV